MAKAVLVSANPTRAPFPLYPIGLGYIAGACTAAGHETLQLDVLVDGRDELLQAVGRAEADVIGLSIRNTDNCDGYDYASNVDFYADLVARIRSVTRVPVVLGGSGFSLFPQALLRRTGAEYGVVGEGEAAFVEFLNAVDAGRLPPPGLIGDARGGRMAVFGAPERPARLIEHYLQFGGLMSVQTKRGCPHACGYCSYPILEGPALRCRDAADVVEECRELVDRHKAEYLFFTDSVFNDSRGHFLQVAEGLVRAGLKCPWTGFFRPQKSWRREDIALLKRSGLACVEWGTDAATDATLAGLNKGFDWAAVAESNALFAEQDIANGHYVIFGAPGETAASVEEGLANLNGLRHSVVFAFLGIRIIPGTEMWRLSRREGLIGDDWDSLKETFYFSSLVQREDVDLRIRRSFGGDISRIYPTGGTEAVIARLHQRGLKGPLWDYVLKARRRVRD
jgi:radical SAM superfamily enzyme YgiQ (UPF0313 family)